MTTPITPPPITPFARPLPAIWRRALAISLPLVPALLLAAAPSRAHAPTPIQDAIVQGSFADYLDSLRPRALMMGISAATFDAVIPGLTYDPRVVTLDRRQPGGAPGGPIEPFAPYRREHVTTDLIQRGKAVHARHAANLRRIEMETGVPAKMMIAIFGHETSYGKVTGTFDLPRSLATLAYEGRRRTLFEGELFAVLKMIDRGVPRSRLIGSWAGAFGYSQFLPSVWLRLAKDGDGDGMAAIWSSEDDALASIANYFAQSGWRRNEPWGIAVSVPSSINRAQIASKVVAPRCTRVFARHSQWKSMAEWRAMGLTPKGARWPDDRIQATLLEPDGPGETGYLLTTNYRVILDYNCSNFYGLSVGLLADAVAGS